MDKAEKVVSRIQHSCSKLCERERTWCPVKVGIVQVVTVLCPGYGLLLLGRMMALVRKLYFTPLHEQQCVRVGVCAGVRVCGCAETVWLWLCARRMGFVHKCNLSPLQQ